ncbi:MAG: ATP-binding protein, partial [Bdellovibrionales bacterium]|nr:ATP-binding protein [Bdellovibrionales bacterium]
MKLVLTGGPSGGKTTMAQSIVKSFVQRVNLIPEAASILFSGGFCRRSYPEAVKWQQKAIYAVQVAQEGIFELENKEDRLLVCDRGTLDGWAYWPQEQEKDFFTAVGSTREKEMGRYDWVIHLDTAGAISYDKNNVIRIENHSEADLINQRIKACWTGHPRRFIVPSTESFFKKVSAVISIVESILAKKD